MLQDRLQTVRLAELLKLAPHRVQVGAAAHIHQQHHDVAAIGDGGGEIEDVQPVAGAKRRDAGDEADAIRAARGEEVVGLDRRRTIDDGRRDV